MYFLGIDIGTSSVKVSIVDADRQKTLVSANFPEQEAEILAIQPGWAEQSPEQWWQYTLSAYKKAITKAAIDTRQISAIGIAYQMHGLVIVDKNQQVLRPSIIWCDSRSVEIGENAFNQIGRAQSLSHHLNSPGNFTASKLAWVKQNEPEIFEKIDKVMLPGDYISMKLTGEITTSISALSEGVFWDFKNNQLSELICKHYGFDRKIFPEIRPVFAEHGQVRAELVRELGIAENATVNYKSGDQPNNALSLNVLQPGEVAATAGTSGVIYGVSDNLVYDQQSRINTFAHVNHTSQLTRTGVLLCINGTGILNSWVRKICGKDLSYEAINREAAKSPIGSKGLKFLPFGNGAERMLNNKVVGAHLQHIDFNQHQQADIFRATQEGIAFSFRYGLDIMRENGLHPSVIRAGKSNLFLSDLFLHAFTGATNTPVELHQNDGSAGAALGAGIGKGFYTKAAEAFSIAQVLDYIEPRETALYEALYQEWKQNLETQLMN